MGLFNRGDCNPPHEFNSVECFRRWERQQARLLRKIYRGRSARLGTGYTRGTYGAEAESKIEVGAARGRIEESRKKLKEVLTSLARKSVGAMGISKGEFEKDVTFSTPPKTRKIKNISTPSIQVAGLETKAVTAGLPQRFYENKIEERPI